MKKSDNKIKKLIKKREEEEEALFYALMDIKGFEYVEKPVHIEEFVLSDEFLDLEEVIRPRVLDDLKELFCDSTCFAYCPYEEAVFDEAVGTGKSYKASIITAYYLYHLLCLKEPQRSFKKDPHSSIHIMNMSVNALQARKVVFGEIKNRIMNSLWFQQGRSPDPNVYSELRFPHNINIIPGHSGESFPLGYNLILAIMDEAAFYTQTDTHDAAKEIFYTLKRRIITRFGEHGLLVIISSPRYIDDFIETKMREAKNDKTIFCKRHAIWEVIPEDIKAIEKGDCFELQGEKIPARYQKDFEVNPEKAWRDLGARPSLSLEPYFKQWNMIEDCIDPQMKNPLQKERLIPNFKGKPGYRYYIHIDLGLKHDACGFAMGHLEGKIVIIDLMMQIKPRPGKEVDIKGVMNWIPELSSRGFKIALITYDQFQSAQSIQELNKMKLKAGRLSVEGLETYETFKEKIYAKEVKYYRYEPFLNEMRRLELIKGKKVDHAVNASKDVSDAVCGVVYNIITNEQERRKIKVFY